MRGRDASGRSGRGRRCALIAFGVGELALLVPLLGLDRRMRRTGGPGIIPFELAGSRDNAVRIMERWGPQGTAAARRSLWLDFPFLIAYSGVHASWCAMAGDALREHDRTRLASLGRVVVAAQIAAGACDAVENASLLGVLDGSIDALPRVAQSFALTKFGLLVVGWAYAAVGLATRRRGR